jgi:hypothetical protein
MHRPGEHLGTADAAIIRVRRRLLEATKALRDHGTPPPGVVDPSVYTVRSCLTVLPPEANWLEALADWHNARTWCTPTRASWVDAASWSRLSVRSTPAINALSNATHPGAGRERVSGAQAGHSRALPAPPHKPGASSAHRQTDGQRGVHDQLRIEVDRGEL